MQLLDTDQYERMANNSRRIELDATEIRMRAERKISELLGEYGNSPHCVPLKSEKDLWLEVARKTFRPSSSEACAVCGKYREITHAHHIIPLAYQYECGAKSPDQSHCWLCPNHHLIVHLTINLALRKYWKGPATFMTGIDNSEYEATKNIALRVVGWSA